MQAAAAVMPPLDWARLATPEEDAEADGLALADACDGWAEGVADACGVTWVTGDGVSGLAGLGR